MSRARHGKRNRSLERLAPTEVPIEQLLGPPLVSPPPSQATTPRGTHVRRDDPLLGEVRGAHVREGDPLASTSWDVHVTEADALTIVVSGVHVAASDPLAGEVIGSHARVDEALVWEPDGRGTLSRPRRRRWRLVPVAGAVTALAAGLGGGRAYAYLTGQGSGTSRAATGSLVGVTVTAQSGTADLLPGGTGAVSFTLDNTNSVGITFDQVAPGATVTSDNESACPSSDVSMAQSLPYTFSPPVTVSAGATSGTESIANLVRLATDAPSTCQGVTFTVSFTLSGQSS